MSKRILHEPIHEGKPNPTSIPARIPDTNWVHVGAVAQSILAELEEMMCAEAQRCRQVRRLAERHIGDHYDPALSNLLVRLLTAEEALHQ